MLLPALMILAPESVLADGAFGWPVRGNVVRRFEKPAASYGEGGHQGIDIEAPSGAAVFANSAGTVAWIGELPRGRFVTLRHAADRTTTYLDMDRMDVRVGQAVQGGQAIGTLAGRRDDSSSVSHLHFSASVGGTPVDPLVLIGGGISGGSFIRLCPATRPSPKVVTGSPASRGGGFWSWVSRGASLVASPFKAAWRGLCAGARGLWNFTCYIGRGIRTAARAVWSNRWVRAIVAGLAAAVCIVVGVIVLALVLSISLVVAVVAAVAGTVAAVVAAIVYAACHPNGFSFFSCFMTSLCTGYLAASLAGGLTSLFTAASVGLSQLGLLGIGKSALASGLFSAGFDLSTGYLLTGHVSWRSVLAAFVVGAASGAFGRVVLKGLSRSSKIAGLFARAGGRVGPVRMIEGVVAHIKEGAGSFGALLAIGKDFTVTLGKKFAYSFTSGLIGIGTNAMFCLISGKQITLSGSFAAFVAGAVMGTIAMTFGYKGIRGLLDRLIKFDTQLARSLKYTLSKMLSKTINKWLKNYFKKLFDHVTKEEST